MGVANCRDTKASLRCPAGPLACGPNSPNLFLLPALRRVRLRWVGVSQHVAGRLRILQSWGRP